MNSRERELTGKVGQENSVNGNIRVVNPNELMRDNPAALIVNKEMYDRMAAGFFPDLFDKPQVIKVLTYSSEHGQTIRDFVLDGMTRTKYVSDHTAEIAKENPDFKFEVRDVTWSALRNRAIVPVSERIEGQQYLTMVQYLRAVIPPTIEHSQIAPDRIAAHLINGWENMVGESLARKYSALAALSFLGNQGINIATDDGLRKDLAKQPRMMAGETIEERVRLQQALVEMASIIRLTRLPRQEVARSAFLLVSAESPVIGGEREARKQIYGLLHTPEVDRKLEEAFSNIGEHEHMRHQLGQFISESFQKVSKVHNREEVINVLGIALRDPGLTFNYVIDVFTSQDAIKRYDEVRQEINTTKLTRTYMLTHRVKNLSEQETQLIENLGSKTSLSSLDIQGMARTIKSADAILQRAEEFKMQIALGRDQFLATGVQAQLLDAAVPSIESAQQAVATAKELSILIRKNQELVDTINDVQRRINTQMTIHKIAGIVDEVAGNKFKEGYGPQMRSDIIGLVNGEFKVLNQQNQVQARQRIRELSGLDQDLLLRVKSADISLELALQRQKERSRQVQPLIPSSPAAVPVTKPDAEQTEILPPVVSPRIEIPVQPLEPEDITIDKQKLEERRKQINREKLNSLLEVFDKRLDDIDLVPQDITETERRQLDRIVRRLGLWAYNHPNTPNVMTELNHKLQEDLRKLREELIKRQREETDKDTRTGQ